MEVNVKVKEGCLGPLYYAFSVSYCYNDIVSTSKVLQLSKNVTNHMRHWSPVPHDIFMVPRPRDPGVPSWR